MSKVMMDSLGIYECVSRTLEQRSHFGYKTNHSINNVHTNCDSLVCRQNLLTALVLWDDIYVNSNPSHSVPISEYNTLSRFYKLLGTPPFIHKVPFFDTNGFEFDDRKEIYHKLYKEINDTIGHVITPDNYNERILLVRGGLYMMEANGAGITYLPHPRRAKVLYKSGLFPRGFDGRVYLDIIDKEVCEYIKAINELAQFQLLSTSFPVLYKFIAEEAKDSLDQFAVALKLRDNKNVVEFRKSVNDISEELKKGNIHAFRASLLKAKEVCDEISDSLYKKSLSCSVSIGLSPSIEISSDHKAKVSSGFHATFLSDLANYGLKGIHPRYN